MIPDLGVVEGYFGRSWTWSERRDVIARLAPAGYRFFHYAPKIDSRLRRDWRVLHDAAEAQEIAKFADHCRSVGVRFGLGLTPYGAQEPFDGEARAALAAKLLQFNEWGIEDFAILFDDMRGDVPDLAQRQAEIASFAFDHCRASRFFFCPTYYSNDPVLDREFGVRPTDYLSQLGRLLDPAVAIYWTGEEVCSPQIDVAHLQGIANQLGRKVALWDNYPVNDGPRMSQYLHLRAFTGRSSRIADHITHHAINPALQPVLGCIPALTLPLLYRRGDDYSYGEAFVEAAESVCGAQLARMVRDDLLTLQQRGLDRMSAPQVERLRARYSQSEHPAAAEIVDWLGGGYAITGEALRTQ